MFQCDPKNTQSVKKIYPLIFLDSLQEKKRGSNYLLLFVFLDFEQG